jgi:hypothetical protein
LGQAQNVAGFNGLIGSQKGFIEPLFSHISLLVTMVFYF